LGRECGDEHQHPHANLLGKSFITKLPLDAVRKRINDGLREGSLSASRRPKRLGRRLGIWADVMPQGRLDRLVPHQLHEHLRHHTDCPPFAE